MKLSASKIASQLCSQLVSRPQSDEFPDLAKYFEEGGSVCALARRGVAGLVSEYGLEVGEAQALALRLNGLATWLLRDFIEKQLTCTQSTPEHLRHGLLALVDGPNYRDLFTPNFAGMCPADAIEAIHSPVAYAVWLKRWSEQRLLPAGTAYPLKTRRVDLDKLKIDPAAVYGVVSSVEVVSSVLEVSINASLQNIQDLDFELSKRRYPNGLPYHHPWTSLDEFTRDLGMSVGGVVRLCDPRFPYFLRPLEWGETSRHGLTQSARLSPGVRKIMTEQAHFPTQEQQNEAYFRDNFGLHGLEPLNLDQAYFFNQHTKLTQAGLEALLSVELYAPTPSPHALDVIVKPGIAGSVFINNGATENSMKIDYKAHVKTNRITEISSAGDSPRFDKIDRLNRKIRLDNALQLPSHETDALLSAIIRAESTEKEPSNYWITEATLRALGLFQMLRENYQCTAEEFAVFMDGISIYGRGTELSQFDRVFNKDTLSAPPLVLDGTSFALVPVDEKDALTVLHICSGLNIDLATYFILAPLIAEAQTPSGLKRSREVLSSFHRMARLPQILGIAPGLAVEMFSLLNEGAGLSALVGQPYINADASLKPEPDADILTQIQRLEGWVRWCADSDLDVAWAVERVKPRPDPAEASEAQTSLFEQIRTQLAPSLFTESALQMAGVVQLSNGRQWTNQLLELADQDGLVIHRAESTERPYEMFAREVTKRVVNNMIGQDDPQTVEQILSVLLSCRAGQQGVVQESLAAHGQLAPPLALPVLSWSGATVYEVLTYVLRRTSTASPSSRPRIEEPGVPFLGVLNEFIHRSEVARTLKLSPEFLTLYLTIGDGIGNAPGTEPLTPRALYYLTVYNRAVALSQKNEAQLLGYLQMANGLPGMSGDGLRLAQDHCAELLAGIFDWSAEEVRACARRFSVSPGYIRSLEHVDLLTRLRAFALESKLDALTTLKIGQLEPDALFSAYGEVADQVAAVLADPNRTSPLMGLNAVDDQVEVICSIGSTELFANSEEKSQLTVTVKRGGTAQKSTNVYFTSTLCPIVPSSATTDENGTVTVIVHAGTTMGRDVISYRLDAREEQPAVTITLRNDPDSFSFYKLENEIYVTEEKVGNDVTLRVELLDDYENPASYESVTWALEPLFSQLVYTQTNADGVAEVTFTSLTPTEIIKPTARLEKGDAGGPNLTLSSIEFTDDSEAGATR